MITRETSFEAYRTIRDNGLLSVRRFEVYEILFYHGPLTAHEVVKIARKRYPLANQTTFNARLSELKERGVVMNCGVKKNPVSGVDNLLWDVTAKLPIKLKKKKLVKCFMCNGKGKYDE